MACNYHFLAIKKNTHTQTQNIINVNEEAEVVEVAISRAYNVSSIICDTGICDIHRWTENEKQDGQKTEKAQCSKNTHKNYTNDYMFPIELQ